MRAAYAKIASSKVDCDGCGRTLYDWEVAPPLEGYAETPRLCVACTDAHERDMYGEAVGTTLEIVETPEGVKFRVVRVSGESR